MQFLLGGFNPSEKYACQIGNLSLSRGEHWKRFETTTWKFQQWWQQNPYIVIYVRPIGRDLFLSKITIWGFPQPWGFSYYKWSALGVFWGYPYFWKHPYTHTHIKLDPPPMGPIEWRWKKAIGHAFFGYRFFRESTWGILIRQQKHLQFIINRTMGTHNLHSYRDTTHIFWGCKSVKPSFFMVLGSKGNMCIQKPTKNPPKTDQNKIWIEKGCGLRNLWMPSNWCRPKNGRREPKHDHKTWRFISSSTGILKMV